MTLDVKQHPQRCDGAWFQLGTEEKLATTMIVEKDGQSITVTLDQPMTLAELWNHYAELAQRPILATLSKGTAVLSL